VWWWYLWQIDTGTLLTQIGLLVFDLNYFYQFIRLKPLGSIDSAHTQFLRNVGKIACKKATNDDVGDENVCTVV